MRKFVISAVGIMASAAILLSVGSAAAESQKGLPNVAEQVILQFMSQPTATAVEDYYGERRQYWRQKVLNVQKVPESPYYEVVIQAETFHGAHNPPYGLETMTFYIGPLDEVRLISFDHQDETE